MPGGTLAQQSMCTTSASFGGGFGRVVSHIPHLNFLVVFSYVQVLQTQGPRLETLEFLAEGARLMAADAIDPALCLLGADSQGGRLSSCRRFCGVFPVSFESDDAEGEAAAACALSPPVFGGSLCCPCFRLFTSAIIFANVSFTVTSNFSLPLVSRPMLPPLNASTERPRFCMHWLCFFVPGFAASDWIARSRPCTSLATAAADRGRVASHSALYRVTKSACLRRSVASSPFASRPSARQSAASFLRLIPW